MRVERNEFAAHDRNSESFDSTGYSSAWLERLTGGQKVVGSNPASPTPRFESEGPSAFRFRATGSVYSRRLRRRVAFSPAFSPLVLPCAPSAPVELVARPQRLARARYGASALRAESSNPAFSSAFSPAFSLAFSPIAFGCKQACAVRSGSPAFSGAHRVRPSNLWLVRACFVFK